MGTARTGRPRAELTISDLDVIDALDDGPAETLEVEVARRAEEVQVDGLPVTHRSPRRGDR